MNHRAIVRPIGAKWLKVACGVAESGGISGLRRMDSKPIKLRRRGRPPKGNLTLEEGDQLKKRILKVYESLTKFYSDAYTKTKEPRYQRSKKPSDIPTVARAYMAAFSGDRSLPELYWKVLEELLETPRRKLLPRKALAKSGSVSAFLAPAELSSATPPAAALASTPIVSTQVSTAPDIAAPGRPVDATIPEESGTGGPDAPKEMQANLGALDEIDIQTLKTSLHQTVSGREPRVYPDCTKQFRGVVLRCYLYLTVPNDSFPPQYRIDDWLDPKAASALCTRLASEPVKEIVQLFYDDEMELWDWAKQKLASAICADEDFREQLLRGIAQSGLPLVRAWLKYCARFFLPVATAKLLEYLIEELEFGPNARQWREKALPTVLRLLLHLPEQERQAQMRRHRTQILSLPKVDLKNEVNDLLWVKEQGNRDQADELARIMRELGISWQDWPPWLAAF
jgi:hypothetical protein